MFPEQHRAPESLNLPGGDGQQKTYRDVDDRMRVRVIFKDQEKQNRQREARRRRQEAQHGVRPDMVFRRKLLFDFLKIRQKTSALTAVSFGRLFGFSAFRTVHKQ